MTNETLPGTAVLVSSVVEALHDLGGHGTNDQIRRAVIAKFNLPIEVIDEIHAGKRTRLEYKLAWARTLAKQRGLIAPEGRMTWGLVQVP